MIAIISIKAANDHGHSQIKYRHVCFPLLPSRQTNPQTLEIRIYNDAETTLAVNGLVIIRLPSQG